MALLRPYILMTFDRVLRNGRPIPSGARTGPPHPKKTVMDAQMGGSKVR
jgi:hypothetical protein